LSRYSKGNIVIVVIMLNHALLRCTFEQNTAGARVSASEIVAVMATVSKITMGRILILEAGSTT
jgi:hypothetical protein